MARFLFSEHFKFNSMRKLANLFKSHKVNYYQLESFIDDGSLYVDSRNRNEIDKDYKEDLKSIMDKYSKDEGFNDMDKLLVYCVTTSFFIIVCNLFLIVFLYFLSTNSNLNIVSEFLVGGLFIVFSFISFRIIKDFYPLLILFNLIYDNFILKVCYYSSVFVESLILLSTIILAFLMIYLK